MKRITQPIDFAELKERALLLEGKTLAIIADTLEVALPADQKRAKGITGQLIEAMLGAHAGSKPTPDFQQLGIELKTIPVTHDLKPCESTYVTMVPMQPGPEQYWLTSIVRQKLNHVLWVPVEGDKTIPYPERKVLMPKFWQPDTHVKAQLEEDFNEAMELIALGFIDQIDARMGTYLQIRPKAMHAKALCKTINHEGESIQTLPRGFYLRPKFTHQILTDTVHDYCID